MHLYNHLEWIEPVSLKFDKINPKDRKNQASDFWATYSDLFMVLSAIFLLLYVVNSLRTTTNTIRNIIKYKELAREAQDLKEQNRVYNTLKDNYLDTQASAKEKEVYEHLMQKLTLLSDEAKREKDELRKQAEENEKKEQALNQYQQIIRNIINANVLAKSSLKTRDEVIENKREKIKEQSKTISAHLIDIEQKEQEIAKKEQEIQLKQSVIDENQKTLSEKLAQIESLNKMVSDNEQQLSANREQISSITEQLNQNINKLREQVSVNKMSKKKYEEEVKKLEEASRKEIEHLASKNNDIKNQLEMANRTLTATNEKVKEMNEELAKQTQEKELLKAHNSDLGMKLQEMKDKYESEKDKMKSDFDKKMADAKNKFLEDLEKEKLSAEDKANKLKKFREESVAKTKELMDKLQDLDDKLNQSKKQLAGAEKAKEDYKSYIDALENKNKALAEDLKKTSDQLETKKKLANQIKDNFKKSGINANVDEKTGDMILSFGDEYFDTGKSQLKEGMKKILEKFMPIYAKSLFQDSKISKKISSVEIIGFSSPTYKGKYVDPQSLDEKDRDAVNYNLDLSYQRSKTIFQYIFNTDNMSFQHQEDLLRLIKVTGRSFLAESIKGRNIEKGISKEEFCENYDCMKAQKVIIKFNVKE